MKRRVVGGNKKGDKFQSAERLILAHRRKENSGKRLGRLKKGRKVPEPEIGDLLLVIRVRSVAGVAANIRKAAHALQVQQVNHALFVKVDEERRKQLDILKPYVVYGTPSVKSVQNLLYKRGHAKVDNARLPLSNNDVIEDALGKFGIVCMEDLVHEICEGEDQKQVRDGRGGALSEALSGVGRSAGRWAVGGGVVNDEDGICID